MTTNRSLKIVTPGGLSITIKHEDWLPGLKIRPDHDVASTYSRLTGCPIIVVTETRSETRAEPT